MILICYDGSDDARSAIEQGGALLPGRHATVLNVWEPVSVMSTRTTGAFMFLAGLIDADEIDRANAEYARDRADEGVELASAAGFEAEPSTCPQARTAAEAILSEAEKLNAAAILMGSRGLTGLRSLLLGSVSHAVIQHADRPVIVVPSQKVARARTEVRMGVTHEKTRKERI